MEQRAMTLKVGFTGGAVRTLPASKSPSGMDQAFVVGQGSLAGEAALANILLVFPCTTKTGP